MRRNLVARLLCPACDARELRCTAFRDDDGDGVLDGVLVCAECNAWYPIEDGLLELLAGSLAYSEDRAGFWSAHRERLEALGLEPFRPPEGGQQSQLQADQQTHFDWYSGNDSQTYFEYEHTPFWVAADRIAFGPWRDEIQPGRWLLDVGCAQGRSTFKVLDLDLDVVGFDISKRLVRQAIDRYRKERPRARATFFNADAMRFPLLAESFDYVLVYGVLHHLPDVEKACREIARVLVPGGVYFGQENNDTIFRKAFDLLQRIRPQWHEEAGPEALISDRRLRRVFEQEGVDLRTRSRVYLPPHVLNLVSHGVSEAIMRATDAMTRLVPILRNNGGVIIIRGGKRPSDGSDTPVP